MAQEKTFERGVKHSPIKRQNKLTIRLDQIEMEWVRQKAKGLHIPMATYMRMAILNYRRKD